MTAIDKRFGDVHALRAVDLEVQSGAIHALVGENGAGKTTLMRVLYGRYQPDGGQIELHGDQVRLRNPAEAIARHVGMVSQHYAIIPELSCLENLVLGAEPGAWIDQRTVAARAQQLAERMGFAFDWAAPAARLGPAGAQKLEILKLLWRDARVMILDEPTAMLSPDDAEQLYASLKSLAQQGATVIVVTHRLPEVLEHCHHVTVLRGGGRVADAPVSEVDADRLTEWIVGAALPPASRDVPSPGPIVLEIEDLRVRGDRGDIAVRDASLVLRAGELVGLAGVDGNGQRELFQAILGVRPSTGRVALSGDNLDGKCPADRIARGIRMIPEDRHTEGVVEHWSLSENAVLGFHRFDAFRRGPWVAHQARAGLAERVAARFATRHGGLHQPMASLSGGNQQRFVAARALECEPKVILAFQPTRGLDIAGSRQVYEAIRASCRDGACALVVSFDLDELIDQCDRVLAICQGQLHEAPLGAGRSDIGRLMVGAQ
jgi:simple sugar transport system ATP-binding protein